MGVMQSTRPKTPTDAVATAAAITELAPKISGLSVAGTGEHQAGIGRIDFVLVDLTTGSLPDVVDRKDVDFAGSPARVSDAWVSGVALTPGRAYRVFFHVYDRSGVNLVAYDRRDFACVREEPA